MKKIILLSFTYIIFSLLLSKNSVAQISGTKTIPGDYATIAAAITDLNGNGAGTGGVTYNIAAGYIETIDTILSLTATGTITSPIVFQKSGTGANPKVIAYAGSATPSSAIQDGIWQLVGADYVTINGIDLYDPNTTNPATMEYGYGMFKVSTTNGCQYNTIKNCVITLNRNNNADAIAPSLAGSRAINVMNTLATTQTTASTPASNAGTNSYNIFYGNIIQNCNYGIVIIGASNIYDIGNDIGGSTNITANSILNYGGASVATNFAGGIYVTYQKNINISNNIINSNNGLGVDHNFGIYGISCTGDNELIQNNTITIHSTIQNSIIYLYNYAILNIPLQHTCKISGNLITACTSNGGFYGIYNYGNASGSSDSIIINNNQIKNNICNTSNDFNGIYNSIYSPYSGYYSYIYNNEISDNIQTGGNFKGINCLTTYSSTNSCFSYCYNNLIKNNIKNTTGGGTFTGILSSGNIYKNVITNDSINSTDGSTSNYINGINGNGTSLIYNNDVGSLSISGNGSINGVFINSTDQYSIYKNKIHDLSISGNTPSINGITITNGSASNNIYNNIIGDFQTPTSNIDNSIIGMNINYNSNVYYNTIYLNAVSTGSPFGSSAIYVGTTATVTLSNNIFINTSIPKGTGYTAAYRRSDATLSTYGATSNNNFLYSGTPSAHNLIYYDGTFTVQSLYLFKTTVAPRDSASKTSTAIPNFISTIGTDSLYLHFNGLSPSVIESGGKLLTGIVDDDFDNNIRYGSTGYNGNGTAPDIGACEFSSISAITVNLGNDTTICEGSSLALNAGYTGAKYSWSTGDTTQIINVNTAGTYSVIVHNGLFQIGYDTINVSVTLSVPVSITITKSTDSICVGTDVTYTATPVNGGISPSYQWNVNGINQGINDSTFTYAPANNDSITCIVISNLTTCLSNNPATSNKLKMLVYPLLNASVSIVANQNSVCAGTDITFTATPVNGGSPTYQWFKNDTIINGDTASTYSSSSLTNGDKIKCVVTSNATPCLTGSPATSNAVTMIINPIPTTPTVTQTGNTLHSSATSGNQWYNVATGIINGATAQTYNPTSNGYYYTKVTLNGCSSDTSIHYHYSNVGIESNSLNTSFHIYPNPTKDNLTIETNSNVEQRLEILNLLGQSVYNNIINKKATVNTSAFANGVYIIKLSSIKEIVVRRFVKE